MRASHPHDKYVPSLLSTKSGDRETADTAETGDHLTALLKLINKLWSSDQLSSNWPQR